MCICIAKSLAIVIASDGLQRGRVVMNRDRHSGGKGREPNGVSRVEMRRASPNAALIVEHILHAGAKRRDKVAVIRCAACIHRRR